MRNVPVILKYAETKKAVPENMALGFAAYLLFLRPVEKKADGYYGNWQNATYRINDDHAPYFYEKWKKAGASEIVEQVLSDSGLWGEDLSAIPGFTAAVKEKLLLLQERSVLEVIQINKTKKVLA
jgi:tagaturonate reductase